jgi:hypothetical protein
VTDYNYTSTDRVSLGGDKSDNNASSLGGYSLDVTPDGNWPGLSADPNKLRQNKEDMQTVVQAINDFVQTLQNSDYAQIESKTAVSYGPDSWGAAVYLKDASGQVAKGVREYTATLITNLQDASKSIASALGQYSGAETANKQSASNQQSTLDNNSTSSSAF